MANPEETGGITPDGRPRRPPPTIDVEAVAVSPDGSATAATRSPKPAVRWPMRFAVIAAIGAVVAIIAGALWIFVVPGLEGQQHDTSVGATGKLDEISARVAKLESALGAAPAQATPDPTTGNRIAALEAAVTPLSERVAELERRARDNAAAARSAGERANTVAGLLDELKKSGADQGSLAQREQSTLAGFADRLKALEALEATLKSKQEELGRPVNPPPPAVEAPDKPVRVAVVAAALRSAVERDFPFTAELAAAGTLGLDEKALAALEPFAASGVPTLNMLFRELSMLVPELLRVSAPAAHEGSYLDRLQANATRMMNIRPVGDGPGDDPATVIGRIELKMVRQDVPGVVAELDKLPAPAKELAQPWRAKALTRQAAVEAARRIASASFAKLGEPATPEPSLR